MLKMIFQWAQRLKSEKDKELTRRKSSSKPMPPSGNSGVKQAFSYRNFHGTFQHALGYGSWWSVLLIFVIVVLGIISWINAWLVEQIAKLLRKFGILPPFKAGSDTLEILMQTASEGDIKKMNTVIKMLGGNRAILEAQSSSNDLGDTTLHIAARFGHSNIVIALLNAGVCVELRNRIGETPLAVAAESGHTTVAAVLLSRGADEEAVVHETGLKPIHLAVMFNHQEVAKLLLSRRPSSLNSQEGIRLNTPLHIAVALNHPDMVRFLLAQHGIDISLRDADGKTAFELATDNPEIMEICNEYAKSQNGNLANF